MEAVLTIGFGVLLTALRAAFGYWKSKGEPMDPRKMGRTLAVGFLLSVIIQAAALVGSPVPEVAQPFLVVMLTVYAEDAFKGAVRRKGRKATVPPVAPAVPDEPEKPAEPETGGDKPA